VNYVEATVRYVVNPNPLTDSVSITAGGFSPTVLNVAPGTTVTWTNSSGSTQTVTSTTSPYGYDSGPLASGDTYAYSYVAPGTYDYTSVNGGFNGSVVVSGAIVEADGTYMRGNMYRFAMSGDASNPNAQLVYELPYVDFAGNESVTEGRVEEHVPPTGTPYCFGDGSGTACPCANPGAPGNGCANGSFAGGCNLAASGSPSVGADTVVLSATATAPGQPGLFFQGDDAIAGGNGAVFGDGLRCAGMNVVRLEIAFADGAGATSSTIAIAAAGGVSAGQTKRYQWWFRDPVGSPCGSSFNLSNGIEITWAP